MLPVMEDHISQVLEKVNHFHLSLLLFTQTKDTLRSERLPFLHVNIEKEKTEMLAQSLLIPILPNCNHEIEELPISCYQEQPKFNPNLNASTSIFSTLFELPKSI